MKKITLISILLSWLAIGCNSNSTTLSKSVEAKSLSESEKLAYRQNKWKGDLKCLKAVKISSDKVDTLCANSNNILTFANDGDFKYAIAIINSQLDILNTYEEELSEGLRDTIPEDELDTHSVKLALIVDRADIADNLAKERYEESIFCIDKASIGQADLDFCKMDVDREYETREQNVNNKFDRIETAIEVFEKNYVELP